jgi:hypothetical protein
VAFIIEVISAVLLHDAQSVLGLCLRHLYRRNEISPNVGKRSVASERLSSKTLQDRSTVVAEA